jgi:hypothetical protein
VPIPFRFNGALTDDGREARYHPGRAGRPQRPNHYSETAQRGLGLTAISRAATC